MVLIRCTVEKQLIAALAFAYAKIRFPEDGAKKKLKKMSTPVIIRILMHYWQCHGNIAL